MSLERRDACRQERVFKDANGDGKYDFEEIYQGLKGRRYISKSVQPGGWFKTLLNLINEGRPVNQQLWISSETASYIAGYKAPNTNAANRVEVVNTLNSNLPAGMASAAGGMDIVVGFSPATSTIIRTNPNTELVATTVSHFPPSASFPSTWVASNKWMEENPEVAQAFINALYEASVWRAENIDEAMRIGERLSQKRKARLIRSTLAPSKRISKPGLPIRMAPDIIT